MSWTTKHAARKRTRTPSLDEPPSIEVIGDLITFRAGKAWSPPPPHPAGRRVQFFSPSARLRLTKSIAKIDVAKAPISVAITLTYPDALLPRDKDRRRTDLYLMKRYIEKYVGKPITGLWRCEWERRKTGPLEGNACPHYHLILFGIMFIHYKRINAWWKQVIGYSDYVRTEIKRAGSKQKTLRYLAKYIKKKGEASLVYAPNCNNLDGRHYGWFRKKMLPMCSARKIENPDQAQIDYLYQKHLEAMPRSDTRPGESFSIIGKGCNTVWKIVEAMGLTDR